MVAGGCFVQQLEGVVHNSVREAHRTRAAAAEAARQTCTWGPCLQKEAYSSKSRSWQGLGRLEQGPHLLKYKQIVLPQLVIQLVVQRRLGSHYTMQPHHLPCMARPAATYAAVTGLPTTNCSCLHRPSSPLIHLCTNTVLIGPAVVPSHATSWAAATYHRQWAFNSMLSKV